MPDVSAEGNLAADRRLGEAINAHDLEAIENGFAVDAVDHDPAPDQQPGAAGFRAYFAAMFEAFPDLTSEVESVVADEERVAIAYLLSGTHRSSFLGVPATGRRVRVRGMQIARYRNGQRSSDEADQAERAVRDLGGRVEEHYQSWIIVHPPTGAPARIAKAVDGLPSPTRLMWSGIGRRTRRLTSVRRGLIIYGQLVFEEKACSMRCPTAHVATS